MSKRLKTLFSLHLLLLFYSFSGVVSKFAAGVPFLSWEFVLLYGAMLAILGIYALGWQQILKRMALSTAFSNKAVTVIWGIIWGVVFFGEAVNVQKVIGALLIVAGVVLFSLCDEKRTKDRGQGEASDDDASAHGAATAQAGAPLLGGDELP